MENILLLTEANFPCKQKEGARVCNLLSAAITLLLGTAAVHSESLAMEEVIYSHSVDPAMRKDNELCERLES